MKKSIAQGFDVKKASIAHMRQGTQLLGLDQLRCPLINISTDHYYYYCLYYFSL